MPSRHVVISVPHGLHARPVADLVRVANAHPDPITLTTAAGDTVDVSSILAVMKLALEPGDTVHVETPASAGAEQVLEEMTAILAPPA